MAGFLHVLCVLQGCFLMEPNVFLSEFPRSLLFISYCCNATARCHIL